MEIIYASDVSATVRTLQNEALAAAANAWGNYGPLVHWVNGTDATAAKELTAQFCTRGSPVPTSTT